MTLNELVRQQLDTGMNLLEQFTQDMTEQDATFQPCAGGVHLNFGQLTVTRRMLGKPTVM